MRRTIGFMVVPLIFFALFSVANAQSATQLQAELNALLEQLSTLQSQLQTQAGSPAANPVSGTYGRCPSLTRTVRQGVSGSEVFALQTFLASDSAIYPEGTISGYFGALTELAVKRFQTRHGIVSSGSPDSTGYGLVGPMTRAVIASVCGSSAAATSGTGQTSCSIGGTTVSAGATLQLFSLTSAPSGSNCAAFAATRQCINGSLSGNPSFQYTTCNDAAAQMCSVNGSTIANNTALTFYSRLSVNSGESCDSYAQVRTCSNGVMSGSTNFVYLACSVDTPDPCSVGGVTVAHGASRMFYKQDVATSTASCSAYGQSRTCNDGVLSGGADYSKTSCTAGVCMLDGLSLQSGESKTFYFAKNIPTTEQCTSYSSTRTCTNGTLTGNATYKYASCAPAASGSCVIDSTVLTSGQSATFYSTSTAAVGTNCASAAQTRTCTSGTLGGTATYNRSSCSDTKPCSLDGVSVPHNESFTFYSARTVAFGSTCSSVSQTRSCTNGAFSGGAAYLYGSCSVNPPTSLAPNAAQLAAALTALESVLYSMLSYLDSWF